jgi:hypothetical protein
VVRSSYNFFLTKDVYNGQKIELHFIARVGGPGELDRHTKKWR